MLGGARRTDGRHRTKYLASVAAEQWGRAGGLGGASPPASRRYYALSLAPASSGLRVSTGRCVFLEQWQASAPSAPGASCTPGRGQWEAGVHLCSAETSKSATKLNVSWSPLLITAGRQEPSNTVLPSRSCTASCSHLLGDPGPYSVHAAFTSLPSLDPPTPTPPAALSAALVM